MVVADRLDYLKGQVLSIMSGGFYGPEIQEQAKDVGRALRQNSSYEEVEQLYMTLQFAMVDELLLVKTC